MPVFELAAKRQKAREAARLSKKRLREELDEEQEDEEASENSSIALDEDGDDLDEEDEEVNEVSSTQGAGEESAVSPPAATKVEFSEPAQWVERMALTSTRSLPDDLNADDDPKREEAFIQQTLLSVIRGVSLLEAAGVPWKRPEDYYAEMYKSDVHMNDVRRSMEAAKARIEAQAHRRAMKDQKKYGKEVQAEVLRQRAKYKRDMQDRLSDWKKKKGGNALRDMLDDDDEGEGEGKRGRGARGPRPKSLRPGGPKKRPGKNARHRR